MGEQLILEEDWTFAGANTNFLTHGFHPYPARMIPQLARRILQEFSREGDIVLDPFCGSGTVLVESRLNGRNSIGVDLNPLAVILAKAKSTPINPIILKPIAENLLSDIKRDKDRNSFYPPPQIPNLTYWFKEEAIQDLSIIKHHLFLITNEDIVTFLKAIFSRVVREVSNTRGGEYKLFRLPSEKLERFKPNAIKLFTNYLYDAIKRMEAFYFASNKTVYSEVLFGDIREIASSLLQKGISIDLTLTSPPYGDSHTTVAYGQFSRFSALWLGCERESVMKVDDLSLGGKPLDEKPELPSPTFHLYFDLIAQKNLKRALEVGTYFADMYECMKAITPLFKKGSYCCFVLANRTVARVRIPTDKILVELGNELGWKHLLTKQRKIPTKRLPWLNAPENIPGLKGETMAQENIIIWHYLG